ncbi:amt-2-like protein [Calliopsis andreniformis]|uniref:amt-2-like protein n=1 Tax=Calliopsis andreniformis TaxID=337506 RepID=UPI003FCDB139
MGSWDFRGFAEVFGGQMGLSSWGFIGLGSRLDWEEVLEGERRFLIGFWLLECLVGIKVEKGNRRSEYKCPDALVPHPLRHSALNLKFGYWISLVSIFFLYFSILIYHYLLSAILKLCIFSNRIRIKLHNYLNHRLTFRNSIILYIHSQCGRLPLASQDPLRNWREIRLSPKDCLREEMSDTHYNDYDYTYYDDTELSRITSFYNGTLSSASSFPSMARVILVILLRVGFVLIHVGSVPIDNVNLILLQNIIDFCWVTITYALVGFIIAYNGDVGGLVGEGYWIGNATVDKDEAIVGWSAVVIAAAICTCGIVGRTHTVGYLVIGFLLAALMQPLVIHWAWTPKGWMKRNVLSGRHVHFRDYAGSAVVHLVGGLSGFIGCLILGRRILRLDAIDDASIAAGSAGTVFAGQLLVFLGLQSLSMPYTTDWLRIRHSSHHNIYLNNLLAASSCSLLVVAFHFMLTSEEFNHWTVMRCVQATVAGLVIVSAGANFYSPQVAIGLGSTGSVLFYLVARHVFHSALEDYCNIVAIHLVCALLGSFLAPLFDIEDNDVTFMLLNFSWQLICLIVITSFVGIVMCIAFTVLEFMHLLRNRTEHLNHLRASIALGRGPTRFWRRLFQSEEDPDYLQPGSAANQRPNVGAHARKYQT